MSTKISWMGVTEPYGPFTVQAEHRTEPANCTYTPCLLRLDSFWDCCQWHICRVRLGYLRVVFEPETQEAEVPFCTLQLLILYEVAYQVPLCDPPLAGQLQGRGQDLGNLLGRYSRYTSWSPPLSSCKMEAGTRAPPKGHLP